MAILVGLATSSTASAKLVDFYSARGQKLPTVSARTQTAAQCGISPYSGTVEQNNRLEQCMVKREGLFGGTVTKPNTFSPNTIIRSSDVNQDFDTLYTLVNGNIDNNNIASGAAIDASKISGTAIISNPSSAQSISATTTFTGTVYVSSTTGFLRVPIMTTAQRTALYAVENGVIVYDTTIGSFEVYEGGAWSGITPAAVSAVASQIGKGVVEIATGLEAASTTPAGSGNTNAPLVIDTTITTSTCQVVGLYVPVTGNNGKLSPVCLDQTATYSWSGTQGHTGASTFSGSINASSTNATPNFLMDGFQATSSTVTSTIRGSLATNQIGSITAGATTTVVNNLQVNGNISYSGTKQGGTSVCIDQATHSSGSTLTVTCGWQPSLVQIFAEAEYDSGGSTGQASRMSVGMYDCTTQHYIGIDQSNGVSGTGSSGHINFVQGSGSTAWDFSTSCSATGFAITSSKTGSPGNVAIMGVGIR